MFKTVIFGRMTPILKKKVISLLKDDNNKIVAMCGGDFLIFLFF